MAITGGAMFLFVIAHLLGNLQIFLGPEAINRYGHFLQSNMEIVWPARIGLLIMIGLHIWSAISLAAENKAARPIAYVNTKTVAASYASRTMMMSGLIIFAFILYHLLHYTVQAPVVNLKHVDFRTLHDPEHRHDVYNMMIIGFSHPAVCAIYLIGMALLCLHLSHGVNSMFQSLGWRKKTYGECLSKAARVIAALIFVGYASIPIAVITRFLVQK